MRPMHKRTRFQAGSLRTEARVNGLDVWVYRWRETTNGHLIRKKIVIGTTKELTKTAAQKKAAEYQLEINSLDVMQAPSQITVAEFIEHYELHELGEDSDKAAKVKKAYSSITANYIEPRWGSYTLGAVKAVAVEQWLKSLDRANGTRAKIREVFGTVYRHAMRHELFPTNPISQVRQARKRATEPEILEPVEMRPSSKNWKELNRPIRRS